MMSAISQDGKAKSVQYSRLALRWGMVFLTVFAVIYLADNFAPSGWVNFHGIPWWERVLFSAFFATAASSLQLQKNKPKSDQNKVGAPS